MANFTSGDWKLELRPADNVHRIRTNIEIIADVFGTHSEDLANANLLVASPKMYHALTELRDFLNNRDVRIQGKGLAEHFIFRQIVKKVDEALALVKGKSTT